MHDFQHTSYIISYYNVSASVIRFYPRTNDECRFRGLFQRARQAFPCVWMRLDVTVVTAILSSAVTMNPEGSEADSSVTSCLSALDSQLATLLSVPNEILLLRHRVFREYAKVAVGPDFIHTLPSFVIVTATLLILWKSPPSSARLMNLIRVTLVYRGLQVRRFLEIHCVASAFTLHVFQGVSQLARDYRAFMVMAGPSKNTLLQRLALLELREWTRYYSSRN